MADRSRFLKQNYPPHLGTTNRRQGTEYHPKYTHEQLDVALDTLNNQNVLVADPRLDILYTPLQVTLPTVGAGGIISGSVNWGVSRSLCNLIRVELTTDTELELMLLRKPVFDDTNRGKHKAFYSIGVGNFFMREGGSLFDYKDESGGTLIHYWIKNVGLSSTIPTLILNKRIPQ